jgi:hypothetical protein
MSQEQGFFRQAIYCLNRVLFTNRNDLGAQWDRIVLFATIGEHRKARISTGCDLQPADDLLAKSRPSPRSPGPGPGGDPSPYFTPTSSPSLSPTTWR